MDLSTLSGTPISASSVIAVCRKSWTRPRRESSIDFQRDRLVLVNAGIIDGVRNVVVYANIGHSVFSDDGGHFYAGGGFKAVIGR
jgi:hypothetical protein